MNPISNGLSSVLGNTAEAAITIATPIAVLYFVPTLFRLFFLCFQENGSSPS